MFPLIGESLLQIFLRILTFDLSYGIFGIKSIGYFLTAPFYQMFAIAVLKLAIAFVPVGLIKGKYGVHYFLMMIASLVSPTLACVYATFRIFRSWFHQRDAILEDMAKCLDLVWIEVVRLPPVTDLTAVEYLDKLSPEDQEWLGDYFQRKERDSAIFHVLVIVGLLGVCGCLLGFVIIFVGIAALLIPVSTRGGSGPDESPIPVNERFPVLARRRFLGLAVSFSNGVVADGALTLPYHFAGDSTVYLEGNRLTPTLWSSSADISAYGTLPSLATPDPDRPVLITIVQDSVTTVYKTHVSRTLGGTWVGIGLLDKAGTSGSGIWQLRPGVREVEAIGLHDYELVGLLGRTAYFRDERDTLFTTKDPDTVVGIGFASADTVLSESPEVPASVSWFKGSVGGLERIKTHCGSGKTRRLIPQHVAKTIARRDVVVAAPTGPTLYALLGPLSKIAKTHFKYGNEVSGSPSDPIRIRSHGLMARDVVSGRSLFPRPYDLIIDESHVKNAATVFLTQWSAYAASEGNRVRSVHLSATSVGEDGKIEADLRSNEPAVETLVVPPQALEDTFLARVRQLETGHSALFFCPSIIKAQDAARRFKTSLVGNYSINWVAGKNLHLHKETLEKPDPAFVHIFCCTDVLQMGITVGNCALVADPGKRCRPTVHGGCVVLETAPYDLSDLAQADGRVGRVPGFPATRIRTVDVSEVSSYVPLSNADIVSGAAFSRGRSCLTDPYLAEALEQCKFPELSEEQARIGLSENVDAWTTYLAYDRNGTKRTLSQMRAVHSHVSAKYRNDGFAPTTFAVAVGTESAMYSTYFGWLCEPADKLFMSRFAEPVSGIPGVSSPNSDLGYHDNPDVALPPVGSEHVGVFPRGKGARLHSHKCSACRLAYHHVHTRDEIDHELLCSSCRGI
jgi:hypothetical protein